MKIAELISHPNNDKLLKSLTNSHFSFFRAAPDYETAIRNKLGGQLVAATQPQQQISWQGQPKFITDMVPAPQQSQHGYSIHEAGDHFHNGIHQQQAPQQGDYKTNKQTFFFFFKFLQLS